jgi:glycosyltransferase involved in cell wall biosynthesis
MRIGVDVKTLSLHKAGISTALRATLPALLDRMPGVEWVAFGPPAALAGLPPAVRRVPVELVRGVGGIRLPIYDQVQLRLAARRERLDLFYSPYFDAPVRLAAPTVVTMHDAVYFRFPGLRPWTERMYYRHLMRSHAARAAAVVTDSRFSREELMQFTGVSATRLHVVPIALPVSFRCLAAARDTPAPGRLGLHGSYVLYTGGVEPRKNLPRLFAAYALWRERGGRVPVLALTGDADRYDEFAPEIDKLGLRDATHFTGRLEESELAAAYAGAHLVVYPSLYEGFGLPVLEAMASGVPVACSDRASMPEVGGEAAYYFDPGSVEAIAGALDVVCSDEALRRRLITAGTERARAFSAERSADALAAVLLGVLNAS